MLFINRYTLRTQNTSLQVLRTVYNRPFEARVRMQFAAKLHISVNVLNPALAHSSPTFVYLANGIMSDWKPSASSTTMSFDMSY